MPYTELPFYVGPRTISQSDIENAYLGTRRHPYGDETEAERIEIYGAMTRSALRESVVEFRPDPYGEGRPMNLNLGAYKNSSLYAYHPRRGNDATFRRYEKILNGSGLAANITKGARQHVIVAEECTNPPTTRCKSVLTESTHKYGIRDGMTGISIVRHEREIPIWTQSNAAVQAFLLHRFPLGFTPEDELMPHQLAASKRARHLAGQLACVIYLYFRVLAPAETIAEDMGLTLVKVCQLARLSREHYPQFIAGTCKCRRKKIALGKAA